MRWRAPKPFRRRLYRILEAFPKLPPQVTVATCRCPLRSALFSCAAIRSYSALVATCRCPLRSALTLLLLADTRSPPLAALRADRTPARPPQDGRARSASLPAPACGGFARDDLLSVAPSRPCPRMRRVRLRVIRLPYLPAHQPPHAEGSPARHQVALLACPPAPACGGFALWMTVSCVAPVPCPRMRRFAATTIAPYSTSRPCPRMQGVRHRIGAPRPK